MPIEIPFMSAIFCMFTQFIYAHMTLYRKLTQNITKGQKGSKIDLKNGKNFKKTQKYHL